MMELTNLLSFYLGCSLVFCFPRLNRTIDHMIHNNSENISSAGGGIHLERPTTSEGVESKDISGYSAKVSVHLDNHDKQNYTKDFKNFTAPTLSKATVDNNSTIESTKSNSTEYHENSTTPVRSNMIGYLNKSTTPVTSYTTRHHNYSTIPLNPGYPDESTTPMAPYTRGYLDNSTISMNPGYLYNSTPQVAVSTNRYHDNSAIPMNPGYLDESTNPATPYTTGYLYNSTSQMTSSSLGNVYNSNSTTQTKPTTNEHHYNSTFQISSNIPCFFDNFSKVLTRDLAQSSDSPVSSINTSESNTMSDHVTESLQSTHSNTPRRGTERGGPALDSTENITDCAVKNKTCVKLAEPNDKLYLQTRQNSRTNLFDLFPNLARRLGYRPNSASNEKL